MYVSTLKILIVEDDFLSRSFLSKMLSEYGEIDIAIDGVEAVDAVKRACDAAAPYDIIFLDIMMPRKDGQTTLREIREYEESSGKSALENCKIIMTTAMGDAKNVMGAFGSQCDAYITKPFSKQTIDEQLRKLVPETFK
jgi:two-component system, chemotaxis family, chemotaxis protein CheY